MSASGSPSRPGAPGIADGMNSPPVRVVILGAAGRDFHNFNCLCRENPDVNVVAFTATQIPDIEGRRYPPELSGTLYPDGIPIYPEEALKDLIFAADDATL